MLVKDNSSPQKFSAQQQEFKKQKSQRFTISNQMKKKSPTRYFREMKSLKQHRQQTILKSSKSFQPKRQSQDNSSESSECDNIDEKSDMEEKIIAVPNLSFKEGLMVTHEQPEQLTHNSSDPQHSQNKKHHIIKNIKKCQGDHSLMSDMNSQENLLSRDQDSFQNRSFLNFLKVQPIEDRQDFYEELDPRILKKYQKHAERNPFEDSYYVVLTPLHGLERLKYELNNYNDHLNFLKLRKYIVYSCLCIPMYFQRIVDSVQFKIINGILIICNLTFFTLSNSSPPVTNEEYKYFIFYCFAIEIGIRIIAAGGIYPTIHFLCSKEDMFNLLCTLITFLHYFYPKHISFDLSPLRIITILLYLGDGLLRLKYMLIALKKSLIFLAEAIFILLIQPFQQVLLVSHKFKFNYNIKYDIIHQKVVIQFILQTKQRLNFYIIIIYKNFVQDQKKQADQLKTQQNNLIWQNNFYQKIEILSSTILRQYEIIKSIFQ